MSARRLALAVTLCCSCTPKLTEVVVAVRSEVPLGSVRLSANRSDGAEVFFTCQCVGFTSDCVELPLTLGVVRDGDSTAPFTVHARGMADPDCASAPLVERSATIAFRDGATLLLELDLRAACLHQTCSAGMTCLDDGACHDDRVTPPDYSSAPDGNLPPVDAASGAPDLVNSLSDLVNPLADLGAPDLVKSVSDLGGPDLAPAVPGPRNAHAMAWDAATHRTVLFGGASDTTELGDTWEWDGNVWTPFGAGPDPRDGHAMASHDALGCVVLYGGGQFFGSTTFGDTWKRCNSTWSLVTRSGPGVRTGHALAYDSVRKKLVLFGGRNLPNDTWEFDGTRWTQASMGGSTPAFPVARYGHSLAFDGTSVVLFGGTDDTGALFGDTWTWDGATWTKVNAIPAPSPRQGATLGPDAHPSLLLFGGLSGNDYQDPWRWSGGAWSALPAPVSPSSRAQSAVAYDAQRKVTVMFGGFYAGDHLGDTWEWSGSAWTAF